MASSRFSQHSTSSHMSPSGYNGISTYSRHYKNYSTASSTAAKPRTMTRTSSISNGISPTILPSVSSSHSTPGLATRQYSGGYESRESAVERLASRRLSDLHLNHTENNHHASNMERRGLSGLRNLGNTCFMNSILQCLAHTQPLVDFFFSSQWEEEVNTSSKTASLVRTFATLLKKIWSEGDSIVNPSEFKNAFSRHAPRFSGYAQQDAQEFLIYLLEGLHDGLNRVTKRPKLDPEDYKTVEKMDDRAKSKFLWERCLKVDKSFISGLFMGQLKSTLVCTHCEQKSTVFDPFWHLSLPVPRRSSSVSLSDCLELFTNEETLDGAEQPKCDECKTRRKCFKTLSLQRLPEILVIQLNRFSSERFRTKLNTLVNYPEKLDLQPFCDDNFSGNSKFTLFAVSEHSGTAGGGHYTASVLHPYNNKWYNCNDTRVSATSARSAVSAEGYVLFYRKSQ